MTETGARMKFALSWAALAQKKLFQWHAKFSGQCVNHFKMTGATQQFVTGSTETGARATASALDLLPVHAYDAFASHYRAYSQLRSSYLRKVEDIIISQSGPARSVLDVGAGDGARSLRIAKAVGATRLVLVEPSIAMCADCLKDVEVWNCTAGEIPQPAPQFDLIVSLWNVLGHIQTGQERLLALSRMKTLTAPGGKIFVDVNHRYNATAYGWTKTFLRMAYDFVAPSDKNGEVLVSWQVGDHVIRTQGHVFTQAEMRKLFRAAGLRVIKRWVVNYETGTECRLPFSGQLLYQLTAD